MDNPALTAQLLDGDGGARAIDLEDCDSWSSSAQPIWVHLDYSNERARTWLREDASLSPLVVEALLAEETRPRTSVVGDGLLIALRAVNLNPGAEPDDMVAIRIWVDGQRIVTTRRRDLHSVADLTERLEAGQGPHNVAECLLELVGSLVWRISDTVDQFEDTIADLEDRILESGGDSLRYELATLRRKAIGLRRYLAPQREALARLTTEKVSWLDEGLRLHLREVSDRLIRHVEDLDAVRERAAVTQEELLSRLSEQLNSRIYVLSVVAAIFLPLGFLTGLLGVNVGGIPGADNPLAFWAFIGILVAVVVFQVLLFRWKRWL